MAEGKMETMEVKEEVPHTAETVWQAIVQNFEAMVPTVMPGHFDTVKHEKGPPLTAGSVFLVTYHKNVPHYDYIKMRWDEMNHQRHRFKCTLVEGGALNKHFSHLAYVLSVTPASTPASCIMHFSVEFVDLGQHTFHDFIKQELQKFITQFNAYLKTVKDA